MNDIFIVTNAAENHTLLLGGITHAMDPVH